MQRAADVVTELVQANRERYIEMISELVRLSEDGAEPVQALVAKWLRDLGCEVSVVSEPFGELSAHVRGAELLDASVTDTQPRANIVGKYPGSGTGRSMVLFAHADSAPVSGAEKWRFPLFSPTAHAGRLYGWGIADDKSGVTAMVAALDVLIRAQAEGVDLRGDVTVVSCVSKNRTRGMAVALAHGVSGDGSIYLHPAESGAGLREVKTVTAGTWDFRIIVTGRLPPTHEPCHAPLAHQGQNACEKAVMVASAMRALDRERGQRVVHPEFDRQLGRSTNFLLSGIHGGDEQKRMPLECTLNYCATFPPPESVASVRADIEACIAKLAASPEWEGPPPKFEWVEGTEPAGVAPNHPLFEAVAAGVVAVTGKRPTSYCGHAASDIRIPMHYCGIPTVGYGPTSSEIAESGASDESIDIKEYLDTIAATALAVVGWAEGER